MSVYSDINTRLTGDVALAALVSDRIWRGRADSTETRPYVVWTLVSAPQEHALDGAKQGSQMRFQFSVFADDLATAHQVADAVKALLENWKSASVKHSRIEAEMELHEEDWNGWHIPVDVMVWTA